MLSFQPIARRVETELCIFSFSLEINLHYFSRRKRPNTWIDLEHTGRIEGVCNNIGLSLPDESVGLALTK